MAKYTSCPLELRLINRHPRLSVLSNIVQIIGCRWLAYEEKLASLLQEVSPPSVFYFTRLFRQQWTGSPRFTLVQLLLALSLIFCSWLPLSMSSLVLTCAVISREAAKPNYIARLPSSCAGTTPALPPFLLAFLCFPLVQNTCVPNTNTTPVIWPHSPGSPAHSSYSWQQFSLQSIRKLCKSVGVAALFSIIRHVALKWHFFWYVFKADKLCGVLQDGR